MCKGYYKGRNCIVKEIIKIVGSNKKCILENLEFKLKNMLIKEK